MSSRVNSEDVVLGKRNRVFIRVPDDMKSSKGCGAIDRCKVSQVSDNTFLLETPVQSFEVNVVGI